MLDVSMMITFCDLFCGEDRRHVECWGGGHLLRRHDCQRRLYSTGVYIGHHVFLCGGTVGTVSPGL